MLRPLADYYRAIFLRQFYGPLEAKAVPVLDPCLTVDVARDASRSASLRAGSPSQVLLITENFSIARARGRRKAARGDAVDDRTMLAAPEAAAWAAHPAARAGKLEKRGRLGAARECPRSR